MKHTKQAIWYDGRCIQSTFREFYNKSNICSDSFMHMQSMLNLKNVTALCLFGVILFSLCWLGAVIFDPSWVFGENMVSDLGVSDTNAKYFFNYGCIGAGAAVALYGFLSAYLCGPLVRKVCYVLIAVAGIALIGVGVFTEDAGGIHGAFAYFVFLAGAPSVIITMILNILGKEWITAIVTVVLLASTIVVYFVTPFPFLEAFAIIVLLIWLGMTSIKTLLAGSTSKESDDTAHTI